MEYYFNSLLNAAKWVTDEFYLNYFEISNSHLEELIKACANVKSTTIRFSKLDLSHDLDFSGPEYSTSYLSFSTWGNCDGSNWSKEPEKLERLIKAISQCNLKTSLTILNLHDCGLSKDQISAMLTTYDLGHISVDLNCNTPS